MSKISFRATIADTQSALKFGSRIGRVTFEVPESDIADAVGLIPLQCVGLRVTVEIDDEQGKAGKSNGSEKRSWP